MHIQNVPKGELHTLMAKYECVFLGGHRNTCVNMHEQESIFRLEHSTDFTVQTILKVIRPFKIQTMSASRTTSLGQA